MDLSRPIQALFPSVEASALAALVSNPGARTGREVARLAGVSHPAATRALNSLAEQGVVLREQAGRAGMYSLNEDHLAIVPIRELAGLRLSLVEAMREDLGSWSPRPLHASLFGSVARKGGNVESDVDVLIVRRADVAADDVQWREQVDGLSERVFSWSGNHAGLVEIDPSELGRPEDRPERSVYEEAERDGILLSGMSLRQLSMELAE